MSWFKKIAKSDIARIKSNISRLQSLKSEVDNIAKLVVTSHADGFEALKSILSEKIVLGRPKIKQKLDQAFIGENNQKIALDSPYKVQKIMFEVSEIVDKEIKQEESKLKNYE